MGRSTKLQAEESKLASTLRVPAMAFAAKGAVEATGAMSNAIEGVAYTLIATFIFIEMRRPHSSDEMVNKKLDGFVSDGVGFGIGPIVSGIMPGHAYNNGIALGQKYATGTQYDAANAKLVVIDIKREGQWEPVMKLDKATGYMVLDAFRLNWLVALYIMAMIILLIKGGAGLLKAIIP